MIMPLEARTPYARLLIALTLALALAAPLAAEIGGAQSESIVDLAERMARPGALLEPGGGAN